MRSILLFKYSFLATVIKNRSLNRFFLIALVPVFASILGLLFTNEISRVIVILLLNLYTVSIITIGYKTSVQVTKANASEGLPDLGLGVIIGNWILKLKLLTIRLFWGIGIALLIGMILLFVNFGLTVLVYFVFALLFVYLLLYEPVFVNISSLLIHNGESILASIEIKRVITIFSKHWLDFVLIALVAFLPNIVISFGYILQISYFEISVNILWILSPLIVALVGYYQYVFIAHLQGQLWSVIIKNSKTG